ncbi:MAG: hypothetical protein J7J87_03610 [Candidatus Diapherotrites archaeon]|nr:hypothetical protein [Candidatus Diapherotrites archaeon]
MQCPRCNERMFRVGIVYISNNKIIEKWRCPACGFTIEKAREKNTTSSF